MKKLLLLPIVSFALSGCAYSVLTDYANCVPSIEVDFRDEVLRYVDDPNGDFSDIKLPKGEYHLCPSCEGHENDDRFTHKVITITEPPPYYTTGRVKIDKPNWLEGAFVPTLIEYQVAIGDYYVWADDYDFTDVSNQELKIPKPYEGDFKCPNKDYKKIKSRIN